MISKTILTRIRNIIHSVVPNAEIILFGSQARGDATEESDIDLLILIDNGSDKLSYDEKSAILDPILDLEMETGLEINPIMRTYKQWFNQPFRTPFYINVMKEGIKI
ncbi:nucleotidyltransferase domain-containing protein [Bacteroides sp. 51]|uniref:nucleotidyltransferase domain-containing protein n=1 Tax=Bacteroides sp. 51 TaxID=2302938 RepID=UPI0013CF8297|nr:nucleotidyltransferase domain-containing protein [Bacteroides sp. 51]NDV83260.1 nucleotidyltransferase domain-containing protein [Bacteroides sp. 51]